LHPVSGFPASSIKGQDGIPGAGIRTGNIALFCSRIRKLPVYHEQLRTTKKAFKSAVSKTFGSRQTRS
jgi:hypothetical protein